LLPLLADALCAAVLRAVVASTDPQPVQEPAPEPAEAEPAEGSGTLERAPTPQPTALLPHTRTDGAPFAYHLGWSGHEASSSSLAAARTTFSDLGRELERMPGLRLRETGLPGSSSFVSIRGSAPAQVAVVLDGLPLTSGFAAAFDWSLLPPDTLQSARVYREAAPLEAGTMGGGGLIELTAGDTESEGVWAAASAGAWATRRLSGGVSLRTADQWAGLSASYRATEGDYRFFDNGGTPSNEADDGYGHRSNNQRSQWATLGAWRWFGDEQTLAVTALATGLDQQIPGYEQAPNQALRQQHNRLLGALRHEWRHDAFSMQTSVGGDAVTLELDDPLGERAAFGGQSDTQDRRVVAMLQPTLKLPASLRLSAQAELTGEWLDSLQGDATSHIARRLSRAVGAELSGELFGGRWLLLHRQTESGDSVGEEDDSASLGSSALMFRLPLVRLPELTLTARWNVAAAERLPTFLERFGGTDNVVPNPSLRAESRIGSDGSLEVETSLAHTSVDAVWSSFVRATDNLIVMLPNSQQATRAENIGATLALGHELSLRLRWGSGTEIAFAGAYSDAVDATQDSVRRGKQIPLHPSWTGAGELSQLVETAFGAITLAAPWRAASSFFVDGANLSSRPAVTEVGARVAFAPEAIRGLAVEARVENVTDRTHGEVEQRSAGETTSVPWATSDFVGHPLPGRALYLTVSYASP
jgi:outer membrane cobalamin receptor